MEDFEARLLAPFKAALTWVFKSVDIKTQVHTGHIVHEGSLACIKAFKPTHPERKYLEVFIYFPEKYVQEHENWYLLAGILCVSTLRTLGLDACAGDSHLDKKDRYFSFWVPMSERVYKNLPSIPKPLDQKELHVEGEVDKEEEQRILDLERQNRKILVFNCRGEEYLDVVKVLEDSRRYTLIQYNAIIGSTDLMDLSKIRDEHEFMGMLVLWDYYYPEHVIDAFIRETRAKYPKLPMIAVANRPPVLKILKDAGCNSEMEPSVHPRILERYVLRTVQEAMEK
jgi:hypothetical protein